MTLKEAAKHFNVSRATIIKWQGRDSTADRPHHLHTALTPIQEEIVVALRRPLLLPVDDLRVVVREFIKPDMIRSCLIRLLTRYQANRLQDLYAEQSEAAEGGKVKTFKDYEPGYLHVDIKYLPKMPNDPQKRYLLWWLLTGLPAGFTWRWLTIKRLKPRLPSSSVYTKNAPSLSRLS